jgi:hypothetical protein
MSRRLPPERRSSRRAQARPRWLVLLATLAPAATACDGGPRLPDAATQPSAQSAEVSVRFDLGPRRPVSVSVLAFRATVTGVDRPDVLGIVDPLAAEAPAEGCVARDLDLATSALVVHGGSIELQELGGIGVGLPSGEMLLRPFPRLYPDMATVVGGVVAEAGPQSLAALPERVSLYTADSELPVSELAVPTEPRVTMVNGAAAAAGMKVDAQQGQGPALTLTVAGAGGGVVELRPFGATAAVVCAVPATATPEATITVPHALLARVFGAQPPGSAAAPGAVAASLEVARRARLRQSLPAPSARISVEVRSAITVELRP